MKRSLSPGSTICPQANPDIYSPITFSLPLLILRRIHVLSIHLYEVQRNFPLSQALGTHLCILGSPNLASLPAYAIISSLEVHG